MNKTEKIICLLLGAVLAWYVWTEMGRAKERQKYLAEQAAIAATNQVAEAESPSAADPAAQPSAAEGANAPAEQTAPAPKLPSTPERIVALENDDVKLELSTWGAVVKKVTLKKYAKNIQVSTSCRLLRSVSMRTSSKTST